MSFDTYTRLYSLLAERINVPICKEKRSDTIRIKPITSYGGLAETRTRVRIIIHSVFYMFSLFICFIIIN